MLSVNVLTKYPDDTSLLVQCDAHTNLVGYKFDNRLSNAGLISEQVLNGASTQKGHLVPFVVYMIDQINESH